MENIRIDCVHTDTQSNIYDKMNKMKELHKQQHDIVRNMNTIGKILTSRAQQIP